MATEAQLAILFDMKANAAPMEAALNATNRVLAQSSGVAARMGASFGVAQQSAMAFGSTSVQAFGESEQSAIQTATSISAVVQAYTALDSASQNATAASDATTGLAGAAGSLTSTMGGATSAQGGLTTAMAAGTDASILAAGAHESAAHSLGSYMSRVGQVVGAAGIGAMVDGLATAADQQTLVNKLVQTGGMSAKTYGAALSGLRSESHSVAYGTKTLANAMYLVTSAGFNKASVALKILKTSAQGAKEENSTLVTVTTAVTSTLKKYHMSAKTATSVTNMLLTAVAHGKMQFQTFAAVLPNVLANANALGVSIPQVTGAIAAMTAQGTSAQAAAFKVTAMMQVLANPTGPQLSIMQQLGLTPVGIQKQIKKSGLSSALGTMQHAVMSHMTPKQGLVVMTAYKKANVAMSDAYGMMGHLRPQVAKLATAFLHNRMTITAYSSDTSHFTGQLAAQASQFKGVAEQTMGFNQFLASGQPAARTYLSTMDELFGRQDAATGAIELTGKAMKTYQKTINDVSKAGAHGGPNIHGWATTAKTMNVQMKDFYNKLHTTLLANLGTKIFPVVEKGLTDIEDEFAKLNKEGVFKAWAKDAKMFLGVLDSIWHVVSPLIKDLMKNKTLMTGLGVGAMAFAGASVAKYVGGKLPGGHFIGSHAVSGVEHLLNKVSGGRLFKTTGAASTMTDAATSLTDAGTALTDAATALQSAADTLMGGGAAGEGGAAAAAAGGEGAVVGEGAGAAAGAGFLGTGASAASVALMAPMAAYMGYQIGSDISHSSLGKKFLINPLSHLFGMMGVGGATMAHVKKNEAWQKHITHMLGKSMAWTGSRLSEMASHRHMSELSALETRIGTFAKLQHLGMKTKLTDIPKTLAEQLPKQFQAMLSHVSGKHEFTTTNKAYALSQEKATAKTQAFDASTQRAQEAMKALRSPAADFRMTLSALHGSAHEAHIQLNAVGKSAMGAVDPVHQLTKAVQELSARIHAVGSSTHFTIDKLVLSATTPHELQAALLQESRKAAISSRPSGPNIGTLP